MDVLRHCPWRANQARYLRSVNSLKLLCNDHYTKLVQLLQPPQAFKKDKNGLNGRAPYPTRVARRRIHPLEGEEQEKTMEGTKKDRLTGTYWTGRATMREVLSES